MESKIDANDGTNPEEWFHVRATHYVVASMLYHLGRAGVLTILGERSGATAATLAELTCTEPGLLETVLEYLAAVEDLLDVDDEGRYSLSPFGQRVVRRFTRAGASGTPSINMFDVRVGCYGPVWSSLGRLLDGSVRYDDGLRREGRIAEEGVKKLAHNFWPSLRDLVDHHEVEQAIEIGANTGLVGWMTRERPSIRAFGIDRSPEALREASAAVGSERARWIEADVFDLDRWLPLTNVEAPGLVYSLHFHELLSAGEPRLVELLRELGRRCPGWHVVMFEQPRLPRAERAEVSAVEWLYASSNVLIHHLIGNGRILSEPQWAELADAAGAELMSRERCGYLGYRAFVLRVGAGR